MPDQRQAVASLFDRAADAYDQVGVDFFSNVGETLVTEVGVAAEERVVDLGCGRGAALFPAAVAVGPTGFVLGTDLAPRMVSMTAADAVARGLENVDVRIGDAQEPDLPEAAFDVALSSLVIFFLPDPLAALRAWRRALRPTPTARLGLTTFADREDARWAWLEDLFPGRDPRSTRPGQDEQESPFASDDSVHDLLGAAGFEGQRSRTVEHVVRFRGPREWVRWSWSHGMRRQWELTPDDRRAAVEAQAVQELERMAGEPEGIVLRTSVRYTTARR